MRANATGHPPAGEALAIAALLAYLGEDHVTAGRIVDAAHHLTNAQLRVGYQALIGTWLNGPDGTQLDLGVPLAPWAQLPSDDNAVPVPPPDTALPAAHLIDSVQGIGLWFMGSPFTQGVPLPDLPFLHLG